jgi:hypothetical protein
MAQTKRKRQTKHRGNAAGIVEARGRTGRPPTAEERKKQTREQAREARLNRKPTWKVSLRNAFLAGAFMFVFLYLAEHPKNGGSRLLDAFVFALLATVIYAPGGYYLEMYMWRRRQAKAKANSSR